MSATLYALVVLQGTTLNFSPGYTTAAECLAVFTKGRTLVCFPYDPEGTTWTAFFKTPGQWLRVYLGSFPNETVCQNYVGAFKVRCPGRLPAPARPNTVPSPA